MVMKPGEMSKPMREALGAFVVCATLGFPEDAVFLQPTRAVGDERWIHMFVLVRYQRKEFRLDCGRLVKLKSRTGPVDPSTDKIVREMCGLAMRTYNATPIAERETFVHTTDMWRRRVEIALQMKAKGMTMPALDEEESRP